MSRWEKWFGGHHGGGRHEDRHPHQQHDTYRGTCQDDRSARGGGHCPHCRVTVMVGARFCSQCGTSLVPLACRQCGSNLQVGVKFCGQCGVQTSAGQ